ncbi:MAG TPA: hypothetical protein PKI77_14825, partial [Mycobacterium sp.]|nr:hypothetical protein [Mycobacterium sp.]
MQDITHNAAAPALAAIPAASTNDWGRDQARKAQTSWNVASPAKNNPEASQSRQCIGVTAKWMTAAPSEALAAQRAASRLSVCFVCLLAMATTLPAQPNQHQQRRITVISQIGNARDSMPSRGRQRRCAPSTSSSQSKAKPSNRVAP